jgi:hypothetical protein
MTTQLNMWQMQEKLQREVERNPGDKWAKKALDHLNEKMEKEGKQVPPKPEIDPVSPPEVQDLQGYTKLEMPAVAPPDWARYGDPDDGLVVSNRRSFGCSQIRNLEETGKLWASKPMEIAAFYGDKFSPRVFLYAGKAMMGHWYLLPSGRISAVFNGVDQHANDPEYSVKPEWPYNEVEKSLWAKMFTKYHFGGAALIMGGHGHAPEVGFHPLIWDGKVIDRHHVPTVANHPWWILPGLNTIYETGRFKYNYFRSAVGRLFNMDIGIRPKDDTYIDWKPYAKEGMDLRSYHHSFEPTATAETPSFKKELEEI